MKKQHIAILIFCSMILSEKVFAGCNLSDLTTKPKIESAQNCMIGQLNNLNTILSSIEEYHERVRTQLTSLIQEEVICKKIEVLYKQNPSSYNYKAIQGCKNIHQERLAQYTYVVDEFEKLEPQYEKLKTQREALRLQNDLLKSASDLLARN